MLLSREFVSYLSRQLVTRMTPQVVETASLDSATEMISHLIEEELAVEDRLNDEVRDILSQFSEYMRREGVSYQDMFRRTKNTLIQQRKVIRAADRDTGDAHETVPRQGHRHPRTSWWTRSARARDVRLKDKDPNNVRLMIVQADDGAVWYGRRQSGSQRPSRKIRSQKREITEGTEEWDLLHRRYYSRRLKKLGIDLTH